MPEQTIHYSDDGERAFCGLKLDPANYPWPISSDPNRVNCAKCQAGYKKKYPQFCPPYPGLDLDAGGQND